MVTILIITTIAGIAALAQRSRMEILATTVRSWAIPCGIAGMLAQTLGLVLGGRPGHALVAVGSLALVAAASELRRWPGGWLLLIGIALNAVAMTVYGRMPITPEVVAATGHPLPDGTVLWGTKDVVADGWIARWLGDRFIASLPATTTKVVFSIGDAVMLLGLSLAMLVPLPKQPGNVPARA